jgi:hypothetical protein
MWSTRFSMLLCLFALSRLSVAGQGVAFTYQGRLLADAQPANGTYDLRFSIMDALTNGAQLGSAFTNAALSVSNGLFTASLVFSDVVFDGSPRWFEIGVRTNESSDAYTTLAPRQPITATPYAIFAGAAGSAALATNLLGGGSLLTNVPASSLTGTVPLGSLAGITSAQIDAATWSSLTNGATAAALQSATNVVGAAFNLSVNTANLPHLQRAVFSSRPVRILWLGDSIGGNTLEATLRLFENFWPNGVQRGAPFLGFPRYYSSQSGPYGYQVGVDWWGTSFLLTNGATQTWGGPAGGGYVQADSLSFWFLRDATSGSAQLDVTTNGTLWETVATVDTATGDGLAVTNVPLAPGSYAVRITSLGGGAKDRVRCLWAALLNSAQANSLVASACNSLGRDLGAFLAMGTNNIATLLTNLNPDLILYEQKKDVWTRSNWPALAGLFRTYAANADVCLLSGQISNGPNDYPTPNPTNSSYAVALVDRSIAISNGWAYVDDFTPLNDWQNIIVANGFNQDNLVHLNPAGQLFAGTVAVRALGLLDLLYASGRR